MSNCPDYWAQVNSLCAKILRQYGDAVGIPLDFSIYETAETHAVLNKVMREYSIRGLSSKQLQGEIDRFKASRYNLNEWHQRLKGQHDDWYADDFRRGITMYKEVMRIENALDFSDLIQHTVKLLKMHPDILRKVSYRYVLADEYQDSAPLEAELIRLLSVQHGNLCMVGDPRQSIYGWRGSDYRLILNFEKTYPNAKKHILSVNYRSAKKIVEASDIIARDCTGIPYYRCRPFRSDEGCVVLVECAKQNAEFKAIADVIAQMITSKNAACSDIAVLCRTHAQCKSVQAALGRQCIPSATADKNEFYDRSEIKLMLDYLNAAAGNDGAPPLIPPGVFQDLINLAACGVSLTTLFDAASAQVIRTLNAGPIATELAYNNLNVLRVVTTNYPGSAINKLPAFLQSCRIQSEASNAVNIMTVHAAKGLEFPVVFISGLDIWNNPCSEENRLIYVAVTRAVERLVMSIPAQSEL